MRHANSKDLEDLIEDIYDYREIYGQSIEADNEDFQWIPEEYYGRETTIKK